MTEVFRKAVVDVVPRDGIAEDYLNFDREVARVLMKPHSDYGMVDAEFVEKMAKAHYDASNTAGRTEWDKRHNFHREHDMKIMSVALEAAGIVVK